MKTVLRINPFLANLMCFDSGSILPMTHFSLGKWMKTLLSQNNLFLAMFSTFCIIKRRMSFHWHFYVLDLLYSDLGPWIPWSCWVFSLSSSNFRLMFDSLLICIFYMQMFSASMSSQVAQISRYLPSADYVQESVNLKNTYIL